MDEHVAALMRSTLNDVFGERDRERRRAALERTYAETVTFTDEAGTVVGIAAIDEKVQAILDGVPADFVFTEDGPLYGGADRAAVSWRFGPPGGEPVVRGLDVATVVDGRITELETLLLTA